MLRVVLDTNVLVSAAIIKGKQFDVLKLAKLGKIKLLSSLAILAECKEVLARKKFGFSQEQIDAAVHQILEIAEIMIPQEHLDAVPEDPDDNRILECALEGNASCIVSGDAHLLRLGNYRGIAIVNATQFFDTYRGSY